MKTERAQEKVQKRTSKSIENVFKRGKIRIRTGKKDEDDRRTDFF